MSPKGGVVEDSAEVLAAQAMFMGLADGKGVLELQATSKVISISRL